MDIEESNPKTYGRLDVTIPDEAYEAGSLSTVRILIRNPFDEPVEVLEIMGPRSSHIQEAPGEYFAQTENQEHDKTVEQEATKPKTTTFVEKMGSFMGGLMVSSITFGGVEIQLPKSKKTLNISAEPKSSIVFDSDLSLFETVNIKAEEDAQVNFKPQKAEEKIEDLQTIIIEPHCEAVAYFQVATSGWLFFTPTRQTLSTQIRYRIKGKERTQVASSGFDIKPPLKAMIVGSIIGALLGTLAKTLNTAQLLSYKLLAVSMGASIVMSLIATIALARKTGTQGFITVEDFFGGFVIGSLIGYGGSEYFEKTIIPPAGK